MSETGFTISAGALTSALRAVAPAVERRSSIPILSTGKRAAGQKVIIPYRAVDVWLKAFRRRDHRLTLLGEGEAVKHIRISGADLTLTTKIIDGTFPDWRRVMPKGVGRSVTVSREALRQAFMAAERFAAATGMKRSKSATLHVRDGRAFVTCVGEERQSLDLDAGAARGPNDFWFGVNASYFVRALADCSGDEIQICQAGQGDPIVFGDAAADFVVMPLRAGEPSRTSMKAAA